MSRPFDVRVERDGAELRVVLSGELDLATAERARAALDAALTPAPASVVVDLSGVGFLDSHGIWLLVECHRRALREDFRLRLEPGGSPVARTLEIAGLAPLVAGHGAGAATGRVELSLYVSGAAARSARAAATARTLVERLGPERATLEIVDVLEDPGRAEAARIIATPTLVRTAPEPPAKLIGDVGDVAELARHLGIDELLEGRSA